MSMRASTSLSRTGPRKTQPDIKPSDVYELKLQTQQYRQKAIQLKTQLSRLQDRINMQTAVINKTFEQQSDKPPVTSNHSNSIPQLKQSIDQAQNSLDSLREQIEKAKNSDKTFAVKELQEEVKLVYCEQQRLTMEMQDAKLQANHSAQQLNEMQRRTSNQYLQEYRSMIRSLQSENASLRDKSVAYNTKREKLLIENQIQNNYQRCVPESSVLENSRKNQDEKRHKIEGDAEQLAKDKEEYQKKVQELQALIDQQKQKINDCLAGKI